MLKAYILDWVKSSKLTNTTLPRSVTFAEGLGVGNLPILSDPSLSLPIDTKFTDFSRHPSGVEI